MHFIKKILLVPFFVLSSQGGLANNAYFQPEAPEAKVARRSVEDIIIKAYDQTSASGGHSALELTNAPISGVSEKRGRHLLSFAAFNHFPALADWGIAHGAEINLGDKDYANMLRMALGNYNVEMVRYALDHGADPNIRMGSGDDTMLSALVKWDWPIEGFRMAQQYNAKPQSEDERRVVYNYVAKQFKKDKRLKQYVKRVALIEKPIHYAGTGKLIATDMIDVMDKALLSAMVSGEIDEQTMAAFKSSGRTFEGFLTFNGFSESLAYRLSSMNSDEAVEAVKRLDREGNDLLVAAIKSLDEDAVRAILAITNETVNSKVPDRVDFYSRGQRPLHIAIQWGASDSIFQLLLGYGADPYNVTNSRGMSAIASLEESFKWNYISYETYRRIKDNF